MASDPQSVTPKHQYPPIPVATDLKTAIAAVNALAAIVRIITKTDASSSQ